MTVDLSAANEIFSQVRWLKDLSKNLNECFKMVELVGNLIAEKKISGEASFLFKMCVEDLETTKA